MIINIALWTDPALFGVFGNDLRNTWSNPFINTFIKIGGTRPGRLPAWPDLRDPGRHVAGRRRHLLRRSRSAAKLDAVQVEADAATGEAVIG